MSELKNGEVCGDLAPSTGERVICDRDPGHDGWHAATVTHRTEVDYGAMRSVLDTQEHLDWEPKRLTMQRTLRNLRGNEGPE